jgi:hypothetical protein
LVLFHKKLGIGWFAGFIKLGIRLKDLQDLIGVRLHFTKNTRNPKLGGREAGGGRGGEGVVPSLVLFIFSSVMFSSQFWLNWDPIIPPV